MNATAHRFMYPVISPQSEGLTAILRFGEKHRIHNTPTVVLANGKRLVGATPPGQFVQELAAASC